MTLDEFLRVLEPQLEYQSMMAIHELLPAALPEFEDELGVTACLEISERARTIREARAGVRSFQESFLLRRGAKEQRQKMEDSRDRALDHLERFLMHSTPGFRQWLRTSPASELQSRLTSVAPPSLF